MTDTTALPAPPEAETGADRIREAYEAGRRDGRNSAAAEMRRSTRSKVDSRLELLESALAAVLRRLIGEPQPTTTTTTTEEKKTNVE
jgi:hypothetical protein